VRSYREAMRSFAAARNLDVWYSEVDAAATLADAVQNISAEEREKAERLNEKAKTKDSMKALSKLCQSANGEIRFLSDPPLIVPIGELVPGASGDQIRDQIGDLLRQYRATLRPDRRHLLEGFRYVDLARKVVGVGSVGTRAWIVLLLGRDGKDPLVLQVKEATASVLEAHLGAATQPNHGQRVVEGQWVMQSASDILLGWLHTTGIDDLERDFYVRQLWDWKRSAEIETMGPALLAVYGQLCGWTLARAHARSGDRIAIASYLGGGSAFDEAVATFSEAYADQNERDYGELAAAARTGRITVVEGL
jgi:uncharacterized protein (DUF2252 family)